VSEIVSMEAARVERLAPAIAYDLRTQSYSQARVGDVGEVDEWTS
jgi:hypothetical protein